MEVKETYSGQVVTFEIDSEAEVATLPTHANNDVGIHSKAIVLGTGNVYFLNKSDQWTLFGDE